MIEDLTRQISQSGLKYSMFQESQSAFQGPCTSNQMVYSVFVPVGVPAAVEQALIASILQTVIHH